MILHGRSGNFFFRYADELWDIKWDSEKTENEMLATWKSGDRDKGPKERGHRYTADTEELRNQWWRNSKINTLEICMWQVLCIIPVSHYKWRSMAYKKRLNCLAHACQVVSLCDPMDHSLPGSSVLKMKDKLSRYVLTKCFLKHAYPGR